MTTRIQVKCEKDDTIRIGLKNWPRTELEKTRWHEILREGLKFAFEGRSAEVITEAPVAWSIAWDLPKSQSVRTTKGEYIVNRIDRCDAELLIEIANSEDFIRGLLWIASGVDADARALGELLSDIDAHSPQPTASCELFFISDDGRKLHWLHPSRESTELIKIVAHQVELFGWILRYS